MKRDCDSSSGLRIEESVGITVHRVVSKLDAGDNLLQELFPLEYALTGDFALIKSERADRYGNLVYNKTARNFSPIMAMAATTTIVQTRLPAELGEIDPETIVTPGVFVDRIVTVADPAHESRLISEGRGYP